MASVLDAPHLVHGVVKEKKGLKNQAETDLYMMKFGGNGKYGLGSLFEIADMCEK